MKTYMYYLVNFDWEGGTGKNLYKKLGDKERILARLEGDGWTLRNWAWHQARERLISNVEVEITKEEAAMILFQCREPA